MYPSKNKKLFGTAWMFFSGKYVLQRKNETKTTATHTTQAHRSTHLLYEATEVKPLERGSMLQCNKLQDAEFGFYLKALHKLLKKRLKLWLWKHVPALVLRIWPQPDQR